MTKQEVRKHQRVNLRMATGYLHPMSTAGTRLGRPDGTSLGATLWRAEGSELGAVDSDGPLEW